MFKRFKNLKAKTLLVHLIVTLAYPAAKAITSEDHGLLVFCDVLTIVAGILLIAGVVYATPSGGVCATSQSRPMTPTAKI